MKKNFKQILAALLVAIMLVGVAPIATVKVSAANHTADEAISWLWTVNGKSLDYDGAYGAQCVDLIAYYYAYLGVTTPGGNANKYSTNALPSGWQRFKGGTPQKGDILVYAGGSGNGHVAIYESETVTWHQNWSGHYVQRLTGKSYKSLKARDGSPYWGCIRPNFNTIVDTSAPTISNPYVSNVSGTQFTINCTLSDDVGISRVWLNVYGPSGSDGFSVAASNGSFSYTIQTDKYGGSGWYSVHLYAFDTSEKQTRYAFEGIHATSYANLGDDFYAYIIKYNSCDPKQIWHFVRQSDNSYKIINEYNGKCMDACNWGTENGTKVGTWTDSGVSAQRWYLVQSGNGYKIKASYTDLYLDCCNNSDDAGTKIQLYQNNDTPAQLFNIYKLTNDGTNYAKTWPSPVTVNVTIYSDEITVSWSESKLNNEFDKREYDLRVFDSNDNVVYSKLKLTETSHTFNLTQSGTYTVSVASVNSKYWECFNFSEKKSFTINKLTICYDCYNGYDTQIDTSKGFYFGDYNRLCTTSNSNQEMDGTANVYCQTLTEGNTIGEYGLHDFSTFGLIAPPGYRFAGWKSGDNGKIFDETTTTYTATDFVDGIQNNDMHVWLTAQFEPDSYLVKFDATGGSCSAISKTVTYKSSYGTLPVPIKENYSFDGWYTEPDGGQKVTAESKVGITSDTTLYAHWKIKTYTITYYLNGGSGLNIFQRTQSKKHDVALTLLTTKPTGKKYNIYYNANGGEVSLSHSSIAQPFKNWNTKSDGTGKTYEPGTIYQKNEQLSLYAQYSYPQIGSLPTPTRLGYSFDGWYTAANGGIKITETTTVTTDITLYAHWITNTYTVTYNTNGGSGTISTQTFLRGSTTNLSSEEPIGKSFIINYDANGGNVSKLTESVSQSFVNWNTKPDGSGSSYEVGEAFTANQNTILYAQYANPILGLIPTPTRIGYVFDGWYTEPDGGKKVSGYTEISENLILFAHWTKKSTDRLTVNNVKIEDTILIDYKSDYNIIPKIDADPGSEYTITYESYDESIAKVDGTGKVHGIKKGNTVVVCTVTDSYGNVVKDSCNVNVDYSGAQWFIIIVLFGWIWYI